MNAKTTADLKDKDNLKKIFRKQAILDCDVLVDGPFIEAQKKITLNFRGSTNQRIIDLKETRKTGTIVLDPLNNGTWF